MYSEADYLPLSALQHYIFCPRQCALIHIEMQWSENRFTAEGRLRHQRVDRDEYEIRDGIRIEYSVPIHSRRLGLTGKADVVEFHHQQPYPVEHKRGRPKPDDCDLVQLCAQAFCLEEMMAIAIPEGAIFYGQPRRRLKVEFDERLREKTTTAAMAVHELIASSVTPLADYDRKKCRNCSMLEICMPGRQRSVLEYLREFVS
jgi:CRISPR-associated exonuclease Cas4